MLFREREQPGTVSEIREGHEGGGKRGVRGEMERGKESREILKPAVSPGWKNPGGEKQE